MDLIEELAKVLPKGHEFDVLLVVTEAKECNPVVKPKTRVPKLSVKIKYFLTIIDKVSNTILFSIEIYDYISIYEDINNHHLFVSKIDSVGLTDLKCNINKIVSVFLQYLYHQTFSSIRYRRKSQDSTTSSIKKLSRAFDKKDVHKTIGVSSTHQFKLSLFTKSSNQYLFPNSEKNPYKRIIGGEALLKWWLKLVDDSIVTSKLEFTKKLIVPGSLDPRLYLRGLTGWTVGSIYNGDAIYSIPNFPDDPKTRFLEFLIIENRWRNLNTTSFYDELGFRQEFRLGDVVGIIGCQLLPVTHTTTGASLGIQVSNKQYKRLIKLIKGEDCSIREDVESLVKSKLPIFFKIIGVDYQLYPITGAFEYQKKDTATLTVNNLTSLVRKKKK